MKKKISIGGQVTYHQMSNYLKADCSIECVFDPSKESIDEVLEELEEDLAKMYIKQFDLANKVLDREKSRV